MRYVTSALVMPFFVLASVSTDAAGSSSHDLTPACITSDSLPSVATANLAIAPSLQQRSGDGTGESASRSGACADAQEDAARVAERACDGPFSVDSCRCERDEGDPDDPVDDVWSCTAYWRCNN